MGTTFSVINNTTKINKNNELNESNEPNEPNEPIKKNLFLNLSKEDKKIINQKMQNNANSEIYLMCYNYDLNYMANLYISYIIEFCNKQNVTEENKKYNNIPLMLKIDNLNDMFIFHTMLLNNNVDHYKEIVYEIEFCENKKIVTNLKFKKKYGEDCHYFNYFSNYNNHDNNYNKLFNGIIYHYFNNDMILSTDGIFHVKNVYFSNFKNIKCDGFIKIVRTKINKILRIMNNNVNTFNLKLTQLEQEKKILELENGELYATYINLKDGVQRETIINKINLNKIKITTIIDDTHKINPKIMLFKKIALNYEKITHDIFKLFLNLTDHIDTNNVDTNNTNINNINTNGINDNNVDIDIDINYSAVI